MSIFERFQFAFGLVHSLTYVYIFGKKNRLMTSMSNLSNIEKVCRSNFLHERYSIGLFHICLQSKICQLHGIFPCSTCGSKKNKSAKWNIYLQCYRKTNWKPTKARYKWMIQKKKRSFSDSLGLISPFALSLFWDDWISRDAQYAYTTSRRNTRRVNWG